MGDIHIGRMMSVAGFRQTLSHETIHSVSRDVVSLCDMEVARLGYENSVNNMFALVNEAITEMANISIRERFWTKSKRLALSVHEAEPPYFEVILLIDGLIREVSEYKNVSQSEIFQVAQKGLLDGKLDFVKLLSSSFGRGRMKALARLLPGFDNPKRVAKLFGLPEVVEKIEHLQTGEPVIYMEGIINGGLVAQRI